MQSFVALGLVTVLWVLRSERLHDGADHVLRPDWHSSTAAWSGRRTWSAPSCSRSWPWGWSRCCGFSDRNDCMMVPTTFFARTGILLRRPGPGEERGRHHHAVVRGPGAGHGAVGSQIGTTA